MQISATCWRNEEFLWIALPSIVGFIEYSPSLRKKLRHYQFINTDFSWQLDEMYVKVKGKWFYLYRAIDKQGNTLDFYFSKKRNNYSAYQFLKRCLKCYALDKQPKTLNTDKHASYALRSLY